MEENVIIIPGKKNNLRNKNNTTGKPDGKTKQTSSFTTLIIWNVKKALDLNPSIDIKNAIKEVQRRLETETRDVSLIDPEYPEERHLACALLAWQQLGHSDADSLYRFVEKEQKLRESETIRQSSKEQAKSFSLECYSGPVVKLPIAPKIVMRVDTGCCQGPKPRNKDNTEKTILNKIEAACGRMDSGYKNRLTGMDDTLKDLSNRAALLGRREAERVELLERAEAAWRDLERGYKRRVMLSEEKEEELAKQIKKLIEERNNNKNSCLALTQQLKVKEELAERDRMELVKIEKELSERACTRQKLLEQSAKLDAQLTECQCKASQQERDLLFKEEQTRRKKINIESKLDSARALTHEAERAMRAELSGLRDQITDLSKQLTEEDAESGRINEMLASMREEKMEMIEDLEGCKELCDGRMQSITDELVKKQMELAEQKAKVLECRCKLPRDVNVQVKRTPSLVALCDCTPEEKIMESCSCSSVRGRLLNNLLSDLFTGLQSEMGPFGAAMPCQLLKCLEDKHNWDRSSVVKTNLRNYFANLLVGELDIAIANSIEKYHAKWVGDNCADTVSKMTPDPGISRNEEGWQERVVEKRAQKLASKLAEQLFQEKAEELTKQAQDFIDSGPPPCTCEKEEPHAALTQVVTKGLPQPCECPKEGQAASTLKGVSPPLSPKSARDYSKKSYKSCYTCLVTPGPKAKLRSRSKSPPPWTRALQDFNQLRLQIEDLKKDSIKKDDLKEMELKIAKIVEKASFSENHNEKDTEATFDDVMRNLNTDKFLNAKLSSTPNKCISIKKKQIDGDNGIKKKGTKLNSRYTPPSEYDKTFKTNKKYGQSYEINTCLCSPKDTYKIKQLNTRKSHYLHNEEIRTSSELRNPKELYLINSTRISKPISASLLSEDLMSTISNRKLSEENACPAICFHRTPSTTSIDKLLDTLSKWKNDLNNTDENRVCEQPSPCPANKKKYQRSVLSDSKCINKNQSSINKHASLNDALNKSNLPQRGSHHNILKQSKVIERENCEILKTNELIDGVKFHISQLSNIINCKNAASSKVKANSKPESNAKINNVKSLRSYKQPVAIAVPENKTGSNKDPKLCHDDSNQVTLNLSTLIKKNTIVDETPFVIPTTESEYLGAVNLDKSNDEICKCTESKENNNLTKRINPFKCVISSKCSCDKLLLNKSLQNEVFKTHNGKCVMDLINKIKYDPINTNETVAENESSCKYNIKFLGVTLSDVKPKEHLHSNILPQYNQFNKFQTENYLKEKYEKKLYSKEREKNKKIGSHLGTSITCSVRCDETITQRETSKSEENQKEIAKTNTHPCECNTKFDKFINCIDIALQYESCNKDKSLDVQSIRDTEDKIESCVCCDDKDENEEEESKDLEKNAFQLLEEHLKQKLEEFKETACQFSCLLPHEEEKLFSVILKKVKKIISESTNNISCKCSVKDGEGHGSWKRAYALLQEYLRIKIKRVQCACSLTEDSKITVLPDVLNKVYNLIDSDFQRLKEGCEYKIRKEPQKTNVQEDNSKEEYETPEKDTNTDLCIVFDKPCQIIKENVLLQVSNFLGMDTKSCDPIGFSKIHNSQDSQRLQWQPACNVSQKHATSEILHTKKYVTYNFPYLSEEERKFKTLSDTKCVTECINSKANNSYNKNELTNLYLPPTKRGIGGKYENVMFESDVDESLNPESINENNLEQKKIFACESCPRKNSILYKDLTERHSAALEDNTKSHLKAPYFGYTIDCSCDPYLGKCVCTKSIFKPNEEVDNIWNKSLAQKNDDKLCYIKNTTEVKPIKESNDLVMNSYHVPKDHRHDCETIMNNSEEDGVILRGSRSNFKTANMMTNTSGDNHSVVTDKSMNEESVDWCDCCPTEKYEVQNQLKKSIYFPVPIEHSDEKRSSNENELDFSSSDSKQLKPCNCDMVPICHVKLLVENIETNLANSKCTCDSMIPKVCPIHSHQ